MLLPPRPVPVGSPAWWVWRMKGGRGGGRGCGEPRERCSSPTPPPPSQTRTPAPTGAHLDHKVTDDSVELVCACVRRGGGGSSRGVGGGAGALVRAAAACTMRAAPPSCGSPPPPPPPPPHHRAVIVPLARELDEVLAAAGGVRRVELHLHRAHGRLDLHARRPHRGSQVLAKRPGGCKSPARVGAMGGLEPGCRPWWSLHAAQGEGKGRADTQGAGARWWSLASMGAQAGGALVLRPPHAPGRAPHTPQCAWVACVTPRRASLECERDDAMGRRQ